MNDIDNEVRLLRLNVDAVLAMRRKDELISKLREALKGCLPTLEDALQDARESAKKDSEASPTGAFNKWSPVIDAYKEQIAEIRALLGEDARKEGL